MRSSVGSPPVIRPATIARGTRVPRGHGDDPVTRTESHPDEHTPTPFPAGRLVELGWDEGFARDFSERAPSGAVPGRVVAQQRGLYQVAGPAEDHAAVAAGRLRHAAWEEEALPG